MFEALYVDSIWHADLHFPKSTNEKSLPEIKDNVFGIIDDKSRYLLCFQFLPDKTAESCAYALIETIERFGKPKFLTTDNGQEFLGRAFQIVLNFFKISPWRSKPRTPQQNGKIERLWQTLEMSRGTNRSKECFYQLVNYYNNKWTHQALGMTPVKAREVFAHYNNFETSDNIQANIRYISKK
jgi:transposase InsO family protein